jgi:hypothetical protein
MRMRRIDGSDLELKDNEQKFIQLKWQSIRRSQFKADQAGSKWVKINNELNDYLDSKGIVDPVQVAKIKGESLALKDALSTHAWHKDEAVRHIADLDLFLNMKDRGLL